MRELERKEINFNGDKLLGVKDENGQVWLAVKSAMVGIGLSEGQARRQVENLSNDITLKSNCIKFAIVQNEGARNVEREMLCIKEDLVTLWLAKISLTPKMQKENPQVVEKLIAYQINCAKVLHEAFFKTEEQKQELFNSLGLEGEIVELKSAINNQTIKLNDTTNKLEQLIDNSTINSRQASKLLMLAKDRVSTMLGGATSKAYKKESRRYFKNMWLQLCERFEVSTYKDLNPLNYNNAVTFISNWSFN